MSEQSFRNILQVSLLASVLTVCFMAPPTAAKPVYRKGELVTLSGRVTDGGGAPIEGVTVYLEASRSSFRLLKMEREVTHRLQAPTTSDNQGDYVLSWSWDEFYNIFELVVALPIQLRGQEGFKEFLRIDVSERLRQGSPVVTSLVIEDTSYLLWLRGFLGELSTEDERRIYQSEGLPDRIDIRDDRPVVESSWWYFSAGKVYLFKEGVLDQEMSFAPIEAVE